MIKTELFIINLMTKYEIKMSIKVKLFILIFLIPAFAHSQSYHSMIQIFRDKQNNILTSGSNAPLNRDMQQYLDYFAINVEYNVKAKVIRSLEDRVIQIPTFDGIIKPFKKYGELEFELRGQKLKLIAYNSLNGVSSSSLFVPFTDKTNSRDTYSGGRYLDLDIKEINDGYINIDFNKAYNPYCAYSEGYHCPKPPAENFLNVYINAGEKNYKGPMNKRTIRQSELSFFSDKEKKIISSGDISHKMHIYLITNDTENQVLKTRSTDIDPTDELLNILKERMLLTVKDPEHSGVGIAAPQVGINKNLIWVQRFDKKGTPFEFFINPKIIWRSNLMRKGAEGCLSIPDLREDIWRNYSIKIQYQTNEKTIVEEIVEGFTAVIFQHEIDHLHGVLFPDRLDQYKENDFITINEDLELAIPQGKIVP